MAGRVRLVPVPFWVKERIDLWATMANLRENRIFRAVKKNGEVSSDSLSTTAVWKIVLQHARNAGIEQLTPHDLRRTCAKRCCRLGGDLEQTQGRAAGLPNHSSGEKRVPQETAILPPIRYHLGSIETKGRSARGVR
jgi:integrase